MTATRRSFCWALEPSFATRPPGTSQRWWLVEMEDGEPRRAFLPPPPGADHDDARGAVMDRAWRGSFVRWSLVDVPEEIDPTVLTDEERDRMRHALGNGRGNRNHYCASVGSPDELLWFGLIYRGLAIAGGLINAGRDRYFHVTVAGEAALDR